ncbi:hypothetical protein RGQ29_018986 [Quercus rubra]|uniref:RBR-type E3 ubiquitin transferase n=1 Tax=Quercus rubra TaxID=3512 RepID=A0AAN7F772_QUERU|nr:hypothetical protein RGQ29_018986 [Quercus rubra]
MAQESASPKSTCVDDFYSSAVFDEEEAWIILDVMDEKCAEELQLQEALMGCVIDSLLINKEASSSLQLPSSPKIQAILPTPEAEPTKEAGESSHSFCEICVERKDRDEMFKIESCVHSFCSDCIGKHVATKIQESITIVCCPGLDCNGVIELDACRAVLPKDVFERWDNALCEELFAMLLNDNEEGEAIRESECPFCHRLFCALCSVPWHSGVDCEEFQRLNEDEKERDDLIFSELAKEKKWRRCPHCKYHVERTDGCLHMTCRCAFQFCYGCGAQWTDDHGGCQRD